MNAGTADMIAGVVVLTPIFLGLWLALKAIVGIRSSNARVTLIVGFICLLVYPAIRISIPAIPPGQIFCAAALTALLVVLQRKFG